MTERTSSTRKVTALLVAAVIAAALILYLYVGDRLEHALGPATAGSASAFIVPLAHSPNGATRDGRNATFFMPMAKHTSGSSMNMCPHMNKPRTATSATAA